MGSKNVAYRINDAKYDIGLMIGEREKNDNILMGMITN